MTGLILGGVLEGLCHRLTAHAAVEDPDPVRLALDVRRAVEKIDI